MTRFLATALISGQKGVATWLFLPASTFCVATSISGRNHMSVALSSVLDHYFFFLAVTSLFEFLSSYMFLVTTSITGCD